MTYPSTNSTTATRRHSTSLRQYN